jgi:hypothetical protein
MSLFAMCVRIFTATVLRIMLLWVFIVIKVYSDFSGDSELPLSRYNPHQVAHPPSFRGYDWPNISPTPLYNRRITTGCCFQRPLQLNCHPENGSSSVVQNIGTNVSDKMYLENYHNLNTTSILTVSLLFV